MTYKYPISILLDILQKESNSTRGEFLKNLGFKNFSKAIRKLDQLMFNGYGDLSFIQKLIEFYPEKKSEILIALNETHKQLEAESFVQNIKIEEEERKNFKPYIYIETERSVPSPIFAAALIGRKAKFIDIKLKDVTLEKVQSTAQQHFIRNKGASMCFGRIIGYRYVGTYDTSVKLDIKGDVINPSAGKFISAPLAYISIGKRKASLEELKKLCLYLYDENVN